jgi:PAS domain S-box-containing protein/putative nucleotidyltransferase with HDIG domain
MNGHNRGLLIAIGFYFSLAIMVGIGIFSFISTRGLIRYNQLLNHSLKVHGVLDELRALVIEAESGQRGYIFTGRDLFLASYRKEANAIPLKLKEFSSLTAGHPQSQQLLAALEPLINQKLALWQERIALFAMGNHEAAILSLKSEEGLKLTNKIRLTITDLEKAETKVLGERQAGAEAMRRRALLARVIGAPISFGTLIVIFYCLKREIAIRRRTEEALRLSEKRLRVFMDNSPAISFMKNEAGRYVSVNGLIEQLSNRNASELVGKTDEELWPPEVAQQLQAADRAVFSKEKSVEIMATLPDREGNPRDYLIYEFPIPTHQQERILGGAAVDITQRKAAEEARRRGEEALRLSEARYRNIFDNAVEGIFQSTALGRFISVNPAMAEMCGYESPEELLDMIRDIEHQIYVDPGRRQDFQRLVEQDGFVRNFESQVYRKDRSTLWISENARAVRDTAGNLLYYEGFAENITARKCAEIKLQRANRTLKTLSAVNYALVDANVEFTFLQDICKIITEVGGYRLAWVAKAHHDASKAVSVLTSAGIEAGYLEGLSISWADDEKGHGPTGTAIRTNKTAIVQDVASDPTFAPWREKFLSCGLASVISLPLPLNDAPWCALTICAPEVNGFDSDEVVMLEELAQDIQYGIVSLRAQKARQRSEAALRESEEKFRGLFETSPDVIGQVDLELHFLMLNHMAERLFGYERATQLIGTRFLDLIDPADRPRVLGGTRKLLETGTLLNAEYTFVRKDGTRFPGEVSAVLTVDAAGTPKAFTGTIRDITERKRMQEKLEEERNRLFAILEGLPVYVYLQASDHSLRFVNRLFREHFGDPENLPCYVTMHGGQEEVCPTMRVLETGLPEEWEWTAANGRTYHLYDYPYKDIDGSSLVMEIGMDITARKKAEESLKESYERLQASLAGTVTALSAVVESKDPYTAGHQQRVTHLACAIAREMGLSPEQIEGIGVMGYLHDIGKIAVPAEILSRPGKINEFEFNLIKQHPLSGFDILKQIAFPWPVAEAVFQHHERLDGSGYPMGLTADQIILEARVLAVADVVEAMASHRPYRPAVGIELALKEITQNKGKLYDPEAVEACVRLFNEKGYEFA